MVISRPQTIRYYPTKTIPDGFLPPSTETKSKGSQCRQSASVPGPERSARSSMSTLVEDNAQIATRTSLEDSDSITPSNYSCLDHLVAIIQIMFCMLVFKNMRMRSTRIPQSQSSDIDGFILPVQVLSSRRDTEKQPVPKRAKCTFDTGNMQGDIVSREFVEKVLEYPESNFVPLTVEEKEGGFGVTGHKLVPEGAIYLTWYHRKSTRVFHNMRFLISPHPQCDLIIGARSIKKYNLLGVLNLMTTSAKVAHTTKISIDEEQERLEENWLKRKKSFEEKDSELIGAGVELKDVENDQDWKDRKNKRDVAEKRYEIHKAEAEAANDNERVVKLHNELNTLLKYETHTIQSASDTTASGIEKQSRSIPTQRTVKTTVETSSSTSSSNEK
ncbi:hypothetical protein EYC84_007620 [Monilinia fructicola]|uniref:Uncharacterized protein n=1 Tax=Monilinia fructicola TaxID=38448 RepID=A0A5M9JNL2_MONFR|nr:hypothetical protein EYC84_007620 [Monilinia fructicola]